MRARTVFALVVAFLCLPILGRGQDIMPLSEIKPGMRGYGIGPLNGVAGTKFWFKVIDIEQVGTSLCPFIIFELSTDGTYRSKPGLISGGMSGSPLFVDGRLIGAIRYAPEFPLDSRGYAIPAELLASFQPLALEKTSQFMEPGERVVWTSGEHYFYCWMWGDVNRCAGATITHVGDDGLIRAQGHSGPVLADEKNGKRIMGAGAVAMPIWKAQLHGRIHSLSVSVVNSHPVGDIAGTVVWDGAYGHIIRSDLRPRSVPVSVIVRGAHPLPVRRSFRVAYSAIFSTLVPTLQSIAHLEFGAAQSLMMRATVRVNGITEPFHFTDAFEWASPGRGEDAATLDRLLKWSVLWTYPAPLLDSIDIELSPADAELYELTACENVVYPDGTRGATITLQRERDYQEFTRSFSLPTPTSDNVGTYKLATGGWIQMNVLAYQLLREVPAIFEVAGDAHALYLIRMLVVDVPTRQSQFLPSDGWTPNNSTVRIQVLGKLTEDSMVVMTKNDKLIDIPMIP